MNRQELIDRAKAILAEAYEEAAYMVALYVDSHPSEQLDPLCRVIDPDNWAALAARVRRARAKIASKSGASSPTTSPPQWKQADRRAARQVAREEPDVILADPEARRALLDRINEGVGEHPLDGMLSRLDQLNAGLAAGRRAVELISKMGQLQEDEQAAVRELALALLDLLPMDVLL